MFPVADLAHLQVRETERALVTRRHTEAARLARLCCDAASSRRLADTMAGLVARAATMLRPRPRPTSSETLCCTGAAA